MFAEQQYQPQAHQQNGYPQNPQDFENEEYETEYESDNQFQPETVINPDLSMNGPPTLRSVTPGNYGFGQARPLYDPHYEWNYDTKTMTEEEKAKLKLHQGSVCQFPEKNPNPNYKNELAEYSHVDEYSKYMLPKKTVAQFTEKNPNPNYKNELAEYSHVDEATKYMIQKPTVQQFQKSVPDYNHMKGLPIKSHIPEEEIYNRKLQLHQGSVLQQPKRADFENVKKYMAYRPKQDGLREEMPVARLPNPEHLLPSQVKKMQTYITHSPIKTLKSIGFTSSAPSSPTLGRKNIWPPPPNTSQLPRTGFNPNVMYKDETNRRQWPPNDPNKFGSLNDLRDPNNKERGPMANVWNPDPNGHGTNRYARFNPQQKLHAVWPPAGGSMINISNTNPNLIRRPNEDYIRHTINSSIPLTYRTPPNTQFYNVPYYLNDENNNELNEQQIDSNLTGARTKLGQDNQLNLDENYYDSEQHLGDQAELRYLQQQQQQQQQFNQLQQPNQLGNNRSGNNSPLHFNVNNPSILNQTYNQPLQPQQSDLYAKQKLQQQQLRDYEQQQKQQAESIRQQQQQNNRSHHLPTQQQTEYLIQQQQFPSQQRSKSPIYRPISPQPQKNLYQQQPTNQQEIINQQQQIALQEIPGSEQQTVQYIQQQPTVVKQVKKEQIEQIEMQKQYYIQQN